MAEEVSSSGVQGLIDRLRDQGVDKGRARAEQLVSNARKQARTILKDAANEAEEILARARREAERMKISGEEALRLATRDAVLSLKSEITEQFVDRLHSLISHELHDNEFIQRLILEVARRERPQGDQPVEVLLPHEFIGLEELRRNPGDVKEDALSRFVLSVSEGLIRDGVTFKTGLDENTAGIRIRLTGEDVLVDLTDKAVSELLLKHLLPRFRAIMEGIVK